MKKLILQFVSIVIFLTINSFDSYAQSIVFSSNATNYSSLNSAQKENYD